MSESDLPESEFRKKAHDILDPLPNEVRSNGDRTLFGKLTRGMTHEKLMEQWEATKHTKTLRTVCIDFVCWYAAPEQMGIDIFSSIPPDKRDDKVDGFFSLRETLIKAGKGYAWVPATEHGPGPQFGDILRHSQKRGFFHVDVAAGWKGLRLMRIAGGQSTHPRPTDDVSKEYDNVKKVTGDKPYDFANLEGWLDIDKYFGPPPGEGKTGSLWLNGNGDVVHPYAPAGGCGPGFSRRCGSLFAEASILPHPLSAAARRLDPWEIPGVFQSRRDRLEGDA